MINSAPDYRCAIKYYEPSVPDVLEISENHFEIDDFSQLDEWKDTKLYYDKHMQLLLVNTTYFETTLNETRNATVQLTAVTTGNSSGTIPIKIQIYSRENLTKEVNYAPRLTTDDGLADADRVLLDT